jgi:uncharacterized membrane protein
MPASCTHGTCAQLWLRVNLERGPGELTIPLEQQFSEIASYIALVIEAGAVLVVAFGAAQALIGVAAAVLRKSADEMEGRQIWIRFATWILLALEFALAADLVRTWVAPTGTASPSLR